MSKPIVASITVERSRLVPLAKRYGFSLLVLFGSEAKGAGRAGSDVDLALLLDRPLTPSKELRLLAELGELFPGRTVDPAILNGASPLLRFQVAREGYAIYERRPGTFMRFKLLAMRQYWDTAKFRRMRAEYLRRVAQAR